jgi:hypothetical protein
VETELSATTAEQEEAAASYEVDFALVLARMIDAARQDPAQMRSTIYELARVKLRKEAMRGNLAEEKRLMGALEVAIQGVEMFSKREEGFNRSQLPKLASAQIVRQTAVLVPPVLLTEHVPEPTIPPSRFNKRSNALGPVLRLACVLTVTVTIATLAVVRQRNSGPQNADKSNPVIAKNESQPEIASKPLTNPVPAAVEAPALPAVYGVYALSTGQLQEIYPLPGQIPDKRVAISAPISIPSRTILADGRVSFVVFRRDVATSAPDRVEVRVIAKITQAMTFDTAGKPAITALGDTWSVRSISYPLRVAPVPGNPEMLALKSEDPDFVLPAGRYAIVVKGQGYDFTVAGTVTEPSQCLQKVEAANGSFYAECRKP